ncbi:MAG TPA: protein kinase [Bacteroidota bacterium]|jgi:serine/threonine protein kinase
MIGQNISQYKILEKLGEGGMGVVYKAEDTKLDRFVALKFLPPHMNASEQDKARFVQEAKAAAALNHPNVCSIIDIQEHDGQMFIVMEFVDGHTLREKKESISFKQAIDIGIQIADGLAAAHEKGIVHRDIKPDNIMIRKDGIAQIMDFGLAKLRSSGSKITRLTKQGSTVGTAGYMSPEQVQGHDTDHRSDIFSFGVLLYELFSGQPPFKGVHETALLYEIVNVDPPPMSSVRPEIDPALDSIVGECLAKEPSERSQSVAEVAKDLRHYKRESSKQRMSRTFPAQSAVRQTAAASQRDQEPAPGLAVPRPQRAIIPWGIAGLLLVATLFLLVRLFLAPAESHPVVVASILAPDSVYIHSYGQGAGPPQVSPDGRQVLLLGVTPDGISRVYIRSFAENVTRGLDGTENAQYPFWSPDGKSVGFFASGKIKKIDAGGGSPVTVCDALNPRGATWSSSGTILFSPDYQTVIFRVSENGGAPVPVTKIDTARNESSQRWPFALPDGKHFLYFSRISSGSGEAEGHAVYVASIDGGENRMVLHTTSNATYAGGNLLYVRGSTLMAQRFDLSSLELKGDPAPVAEDVMFDPGFNLSVFSASETGILVYQQGRVRSGAKLLLTDRTGKTLSTLGESIEHFYVRYSPDGQHIVGSIFDPKLLRLNCWEYDLRTGGRTRITSGTSEGYPLLSRDGSVLIFNSQRTGNWNLYQKSMKGQGGELALHPGPSEDYPADWSPDGSSILISRIEPSKTKSDLWLMQLSGAREQYPIANTDFDEIDGKFSPDGKWIAYVSNESGEYEVYVKPTGKSETQSWKISSGGGGVPRWAGISNEICYVNKENKMTLATLRYKDKTVEVVNTHPLFTAPVFLESYSISPDGKTMVINRFLEATKSVPLTMMLHWDEALKKK